MCACVVCWVSFILLWLTMATGKKTHICKLLVITHVRTILRYLPVQSASFLCPQLMLDHTPSARIPLFVDEIEFGWQQDCLCFDVFLFGLSKKKENNIFIALLLWKSNVPWLVRNASKKCICHLLQLTNILITLFVCVLCRFYFFCAEASAEVCEHVCMQLSEQCLRGMIPCFPHNWVTFLLPQIKSLPIGINYCENVCFYCPVIDWCHAPGLFSCCT